MCLPLAADGPALARGGSLQKSLTQSECGGAKPRVWTTYTLPVSLQVSTCKKVFKRTFISSSVIITLPRGILETLCSSRPSQIPPSLTFSPPAVTPSSFSRGKAGKKKGGKLCAGGSWFCISAHDTPCPTPPHPARHPHVWNSGEITSRFPSLHPKYELLPDLLMNVIKYTKLFRLGEECNCYSRRRRQWAASAFHSR